MASTKTPRDSASTVITPLTPSDLLRRSAGSDNGGSFTTSSSSPSTTYNLDSPNEWSTVNTAENSETDTRATTPDNLEARSRYDRWPCPFDSGITCEPADVQAQPTTEIAFLYHVEAQIARIEHITSGFQAYQAAINRELDPNQQQRHPNNHPFTQDFLTNQPFAIATTIEHLSSVKRDLTAAHASVLAWKKMDHGQLPVQHRHGETLAAAKVWLDKQVRVLTQCHVFYKVNYALVVR